MFIRIPLGRDDSPVNSQRTVDAILSSVQWQFALVYLLDIVLFSNSPAYHIEKVRHVLQILCEPETTLELNKYWSSSETIDYLGQAIIPGRLEHAEHTTDAVAKHEHPTTQTKIGSFLGLCSLFGPFVPNFARLAASVNKKLKVDQPKQYRPLDEKEGAAVLSLNESLIGPPVLSLPRTEGSYTLDTDVYYK